jgi:hypothetical protein
MPKFVHLTLAAVLVAFVALGAAAQDQKPQPPPASVPAPPSPALNPPPPRQTPPPSEAPSPKPVPSFEEVIDIDACLSSTQVQNGTAEICRSPAGVSVTASLQAGVLRSLTFKDGSGRGVMVQVRPDPIPMGLCWKCVSSPATGFSCSRILCNKKAPPPAPATPAK